MIPGSQVTWRSKEAPMYHKLCQEPYVAAPALDAACSLCSQAVCCQAAPRRMMEDTASI